MYCVSHHRMNILGRSIQFDYLWSFLPRSLFDLIIENILVYLLSSFAMEHHLRLFGDSYHFTDMFSRFGTESDEEE